LKTIRPRLDVVRLSENPGFSDGLSSAAKGIGSSRGIGVKSIGFCVDGNLPRHFSKTIQFG
jgi:hypothetical protein